MIALSSSLPQPALLTRLALIAASGLLFAVTPAQSQTREWTWIGGSSVWTNGLNGVYGTKGVAAPGNVPGGRADAVGWTDANGNLWLFGGNGISPGNISSTHFNDLWKFDPSSNQWTWMSGADQQGSGVYGTQGVSSPDNVPGARLGGVGWTDHANNLWLFGGWGYDSAGIFGSLNDLWKFDTATNQWTWISGSKILPNDNLGCQPGIYGTLGVASPDNVPGGRILPGGFTGSDGTLWLFGGGGCDADDNQQILNDLWRFDPSTNEWTWMSGSKTGSPTGVYGTLGQPAAANVPGGRWEPVTWSDTQGNFWLFGSSGIDSTGLRGYLNDLWKFTPAIGQWTWMSGSSTMGTENCYMPAMECAPSGVYGTLGQPSPSNVPGGRTASVGSLNATGKLLLFGGGNNPSGLVDFYNDLWEFDPATKEWAWISGSDNLICVGKDNAGDCVEDGQPGIYGALGISAPTNVPGSRESGLSWTDRDGNFWIFGGEGSDSGGQFGLLNDLWVYRLPPPAFTLASSLSTLTMKAGTEGSVTLTITPQNGFDSAVTFSCSGLPSGTTCSFSPASLTPSGSAATSQLTISASTSASIAHPGLSPRLPAAALALAGCLLFGWRRRRLSWLAVLLLFTGLAGPTACSSVNGMTSPPPPPAPPTVASVTITAESGALKQTATLTLTVTH